MEEKNEVKQEEIVKTQEVKKEEPKKEKKDNIKRKRLISRIVNIVLWIILIAWMILVVIDYLHVNKEEEPQFCFWNHNTTKYDDGVVEECTGLGYKVINYKRESFKALEFGPFWVKDRTAEK